MKEKEKEKRGENATSHLQRLSIAAMETDQADIHDLYNHYIFYMKTTNRKLFVYKEDQIDMVVTAAHSLRAITHTDCSNEHKNLRSGYLVCICYRLTRRMTTRDEE